MPYAVLNLPPAAPNAAYARASYFVPVPGPPGADGQRGIDGLPGPTGSTGPQGIQGVQGVQGIQGAAGSGATDETLLSLDPTFANAHAITLASGLPSYETWTDASTGKLRKRVDYTWIAGALDHEVRKVFSAADGTTVTFQETVTYAPGYMADALVRQV